MKRTNDFLVGLTVIAAVAVVTLAILWVKQSDLGRKRSEVTARFRDVGSVRVGAQVVIRGVQAGRVESLSRSPIGGSTGRRATCRPRLSQPATGYVIFHLDPPCTPMYGSCESGRKSGCETKTILQMRR